MRHTRAKSPAGKTEMKRQDNEFSRITRLDEIEAGTPTAVVLEAGPDECAALAKRLSLLALDRLRAELRVWRIKDGLRISGRLCATGSQACVVTLEPVAFALDEPVELALYRADALAREEERLGEAQWQETLDLDVLEGEEVDLGEIVAQSLSLALPAYPRAPHADEVMSRYAPEAPDGDRLEPAVAERGNPFAKLADLLIDEKKRKE